MRGHRQEFAYAARRLLGEGEGGVVVLWQLSIYKCNDVTVKTSLFSGGF